MQLCVCVCVCCCCCSITKSCPTLCNPMNCSTPGFPVLHYLPEFAQTHIHWVSDAIQPSHPLLPPSPLALNLSQNQGGSFKISWLFTSGDQVTGASASASIFQWIFRVDFLQDWLVWSSCCPRDSQESFPTLQFKSTQPSLWSNSHICTWLLEKP